MRPVTRIVTVRQYYALSPQILLDPTCSGLGPSREDSVCAGLRSSYCKIKTAGRAGAMCSTGPRSATVSGGLCPLYRSGIRLWSESCVSTHSVSVAETDTRDAAWSLDPYTLQPVSTKNTFSTLPSWLVQPTPLAPQKGPCIKRNISVFWDLHVQGVAGSGLILHSNWQGEKNKVVRGCGKSWRMRKERTETHSTANTYRIICMYIYTYKYIDLLLLKTCFLCSSGCPRAHSVDKASLRL